jgi:hypothetical protein
MATAFTRRSERMRKKTLVKLLATIAVVLCVGGGAAIALTTDNSDSAPTIYQAQTSRPTITATDTALTDAVATLRRRQTDADVLGADVRLDPYAEQHGANRALARRARLSPSGGSVYLVPADGGVCVASTDYLFEGCRSTEDAVTGSDMTATDCSPFLPAGDLLVYGILPDSASDVSIGLADGTSVPASVDGNLLIYEASKSAPLPETVRWTSLGSAHSAPTNMPDDVANLKCEQSVTPAQAVARVNATTIDAAPANAGPTNP